MGEALKLFLGNLDQTRMAMTGSQNCNACIHIEEAIAIDIPDLAALRMGQSPGVHRSEWGNYSVIASHQLLRLVGPRNRAGM